MPLDVPVRQQIVRLGLAALLASAAMPSSDANDDPADAFVSRQGKSDPISGTGYAPVAISYRGKMLYFMNTPLLGYTHMYVAKDASPKKFLTISPQAILIPEANLASRVKPVALGSDLYLCTFFPKRGEMLRDGIRVIKGRADRKKPDSIEKMEWDAGKFYESDGRSDWVDGDATVFRPKGGREAIYIVRAWKDSITIHRYSGGNLKQVTRSVFPGKTLHALSISKFQSADGRGRIAIAWIEEEGRPSHRTLKLGIFDGRGRIRPVSASSEIDSDHRYVPVGVSLAAGTVMGGTPRANLLQIFIEDGRGSHARLLRAEYAIGEGDGTNGQFLDQAGPSKTRPVLMGNGIPVGAANKGSSRMFSFDRPRQLSVFNFLQPREYQDRSTNSSNIGYTVNIGILGTDSEGRINAIYTKSDRLVPYGIVRSGNKWVEQRGAQPDAIDTDGDYRSWIHLGTIYGTPPSARDGGGGAVQISKSRSEGAAFTFTNTTSAGSKVGWQSIWEWSLELKYEFEYESEKEKAITTSMNRTLEFDADRPDRGWLVFLKPTLAIENFRRCDFAGNPIPRAPGSDEGFSLLVATTKNWSVVPKPFDMTARPSDLPPYARGIETNPGWSSAHPANWTAMQRYVGDKNDFEEPIPMDSLVGKSSSSLSLTYSGSNRYTHSASVNFELLFLGVIGPTFSETLKWSNTYQTSNSYSVEISMDKGGFVQPHALIAKAGRRPYFIPSAYRNQEKGQDDNPPPFCIIYSTTNARDASSQPSRSSSFEKGTDIPRSPLSRRLFASPLRIEVSHLTAISSRVRTLNLSPRATFEDTVILQGRAPNPNSRVWIRHGARKLATRRAGHRWAREVRLRVGRNVFYVETENRGSKIPTRQRIVVVRNK